MRDSANLVDIKRMLNCDMNSIKKITEMKIIELKNYMSTLNLDTRGPKAVIIKRLQDAIGSDVIENEDQPDEVSPEETEESETVKTTENVKKNCKVSKLKLTIKSLRKKITFLQSKVLKLETVVTKLVKSNNKLRQTKIESKNENVNVKVKDSRNSVINDKKKVVAEEENTGAVINNPTSEIVTESLTDTEGMSPSLKNVIIQDNIKILPRILLLADSHGRGLAQNISDLLPPNSYSVQSIFKPNAVFNDVLVNSKDLTKSFDKEDFVFILAGSNDAIRSTKLSADNVTSTLNNLNKTNVIVLSAPYWHGRDVLNQFIYNINNKMYTAVNNAKQINPSIKFIDVNHFLEKTHFTTHETYE